MIAGTVVAVVTGLLAYQYLDRRAQLEATAFAGARAQAVDAAQEIETVFGELMVIATDIADDLTDGTLPYTDIHDRLWAEVAARPDLDGLAITFAPYMYDPDLRLYQSYISQDGSGEFSLLDGATYDYTQRAGDDPDGPQTDWYYGPLENGPMWNEPFLATGAGRVLIEYGVPFYRETTEGRIPAGVVTIDYSLRGMRDLMGSLQLGATGYGMVVSGSGTLLAYPVQEAVGQQSIRAVADERIVLAVEAALAGETTAIEQPDPVTGRAAWSFFRPIATTGWVMGIVMNHDELLPSAQATRREQVTITLAAGLTAFLMTCFLVQFDRRMRRYWTVAIAFSVISLLIILLVWRLVMTGGRDNGVALTNQVAVERSIETYRASLNATDPVYTVPTGILIQAVAFPDAMSVTVNGYVWQRYREDIPDDIARGFMLPQRIGEEATVEEVNRQVDGDEEIITWYIGVTLRQSFETVRFPFDRRAITVRLNPLELRRNVILTPDLQSYDLINPLLLPGLDGGVNVNNWEMLSSSFSYRPANYTTTLGISDRATRPAAPELAFTVDARRYFLGPFIAYLLPGIVAAGMMFAFLSSDRQPGDREEIVTALNYAAALFFVVAVAHTAMRDSIAAEGLTYLEHLYVLLYIAIVAVAVDVFLLAKRPNAFIVRYGNNLLWRLFYWPVFSGALLVSTLVLFVYG